jgi:2-polyprenyl-3-methyl-5-hydroxy-6-metoxy-1,4-benzoquinol methylase
MTAAEETRLRHMGTGASPAGVASLPALEVAVTQTLQVAAQTGLPPDWLTDRLGVSLSLLGEAIKGVDDAGYDRSVILSRIEPVRQLARRSALARHAQDWPHGYVGDFQIFERLWDGRPDESDPVGSAIEEVVLSSPIVQQYRNAVRWLARDVENTLRDGPAAMAFLGCAGGLELMLACERFPAARLSSLVLVDQSPDALTLATSRIPDGTALECEVWAADAVRALRRLGRRNVFDVVVVGQLFSHLADPTARFVVGRAMTHLLRPGGRLLFTNVNRDNPYRSWTDYLVDWPLEGRSLSGLQSVTDAAAPCTRASSYERDDTGLAWLVTLTRNAC